MQTYSTATGNGPAKEKAKEQAQQMTGQARSTVRSQVDQRSTEAGERVGGFASDMRSVGQQLRDQGKEQPAKIAEQAADRAERLGGYLTSSDADRILNDLEDFGRRRPWAVIAGGLALGLAASRFLKASSTNRYEQRRAEGYDQSHVRSYDPSPARAYETPPATSSIRPDPITTGSA